MRLARDAPSPGAEGAFRTMLLLYPAAFRQQHGDDMLEYFRDAWRSAGPESRGRLLVRFMLSTVGCAVRQRLRHVLRMPSLWRRPGDPLMRELLSDIVYALRLFRRSPVFTAVAVVTLALGVGANTAIFSLVSAALLRELPYADASALVSLWLTIEERGVSREMASLAEVLDWQEQAGGIESIGAYGPMGYALMGNNGAQNIEAVLATPGLFITLGVPTLHGRGLQPEDTESDAAPVVVISNWLWLQQFGGDADLSQAFLDLDGAPVRVVGVMPPSFRLSSRYLDNIGIYAPFTYERAALSRQSR